MRPTNPFLIPLVVLCLGIGLVAGNLHADDAPPPGRRVFTCGHSFHYFVPPLLTEMAAAAGIEGHTQVGLSRIGGSTVQRHWDVPDEANDAKRALAEARVDVLTLSPIWLPDEGIENFARLAFAHNPRAEVTVQAFWLPNDEYRPVYPLETRKGSDHEAATVESLRAPHAAYFADVDAVVREINAKLGRPVVRVVPVGQAVLALRERVIAGTMPGIATQAELFTDTWGHPDAPVRVLTAYCHYAVIYRRSPVGLPVPRALAAAKRTAWHDPALNRVLQELAWEAATAHPLSGIHDDSAPGPRGDVVPPAAHANP